MFNNNNFAELMALPVIKKGVFQICKKSKEGEKEVLAEDSSISKVRFLGAKVRDFKKQVGKKTVTQNLYIVEAEAITNEGEVTTLDFVFFHSMCVTFFSYWLPQLAEKAQKGEYVSIFFKPATDQKSGEQLVSNHGDLLYNLSASMKLSEEAKDIKKADEGATDEVLFRNVTAFAQEMTRASLKDTRPTANATAQDDDLPF